MVWRSESLRLGELVWTHIIQCFVYKVVYYFTEPSEVKVRFWKSLEVNQLLSYNQSLRHFPAKLGLKCSRKLF